QRGLRTTSRRALLQDVARPRESRGEGSRPRGKRIRRAAAPVAGDRARDVVGSQTVPGETARESFLVPLRVDARPVREGGGILTGAGVAGARRREALGERLR